MGLNFTVNKYQIIQILKKKKKKKNQNNNFEILKAENLI